MTDQPLRTFIRDYLSGRDLNVTEDPDDGTMSFSVELDVASFDVHVRADEPERHVIVHAVVPHSIPELHRIEVALFLTRANYGLGSGCFEFDLDDGEVRFRSSIDLGDVELTDALFEPLIGYTLAAMSRYVPGIAAVLAGVPPRDAIDVVEG